MCTDSHLPYSAEHFYLRVVSHNIKKKFVSSILVYLILLQVKKENKIQQAEKITQEISDLKIQMAGCDKELLQLSEKFKCLGEKKEKVVKESSQLVPWKKGELALFTTTTGIRWNFGCNDDEIRGYVAGKNCIKPFSINSDEHDSFHIANYLWDVIESAYKI